MNTFELSFLLKRETCFSNTQKNAKLNDKLFALGLYKYLMQRGKICFVSNFHLLHIGVVLP